MNSYLKKNKIMLKVGLTGGMGSGKSTVKEIFSLLKIPVFDCDFEAKQLLEKDSGVVDSVKSLLGADSYKNGKPDKKYIAAKIFENKELLAEMNNIIHPVLLVIYHKWVEQNKDCPYSVMESAILIESGYYKDVDKIITVNAPETIRIERVVKRDKVVYETVKKRMEAQITDVERDKYADYIIMADENELVVPQILKIDSELKHLKYENDPRIGIDNQ